VWLNDCCRVPGKNTIITYLHSVTQWLLPCTWQEYNNYNLWSPKLKSWLRPWHLGKRNANENTVHCITCQKSMSSWQVLVMVALPEPNHVQPPGCHHGRTVSLSDSVTMTQVKQSVPGHGSCVAADMIGIFSDRCLALGWAEPVAH